MPVYRGIRIVIGYTVRPLRDTYTFYSEFVIQRDTQASKWLLYYTHGI